MTAPGGPKALRLVELPEPEISGEHDVTVRLRAAAINPADYKQRADEVIGGTLPVVLGSDGAGIVESIGPGVSRFQAGDEVYFCDGGFGTSGTCQEVRIACPSAPCRRPG
jgi:NADPH2:quinone reductase